MKLLVVQKPKREFSLPSRALLLALLAVLLAALTAADSTAAAPEAEQIPLGPSDERLLAVREQTETLFLVTEAGSGVNIYRLDARQPQPNPEPLFWSHPPAMVETVGGNLRFLCTDSGIPVLYTFDPGWNIDEIVQNSTPYFVFPDSNSLLAPSPDGEMMYIASPFGILQIAEAQGDELTPVLDSQGNYFDNVEFLTVTKEGWFHMYADGVLYRWRDSLQRDLKTYSIAGIDRLVGEDYCVDGTGVLCRREEDGMQPLLSGEDLDFALCCQAEEGVLAADAQGIVHKYTEAGEETGASPMDGRIVAVTSLGAIVEKEGSYRFSPYTFSQENQPGPEPTEEPEATETPGPTEPPPPVETPAPSPSSGPSLDEAGVAYEGAYITMKAGMTVEQLVELIRPDQALIRNAKGETVTSGRMATDMKVNDYTVVVYGDCSGSGRLSPADLYIVQSALVEEDRFSSPARQKAADLTGDGLVDTRDLVALLGEIELYAGVKGRFLSESEVSGGG